MNEYSGLAASGAPGRELFQDKAGAARLGIRLGIISLAMLFIGLIGAFVVQRSGSAKWPPEGVRLSFTLGSINTAVILASSAALAAALRSSRRGRTEETRVALLLGGGLALLFLGFQALQYYWLITNFGQTLSSSQFGTYFYCLTGLHGLHLLAGVLWLLILMTGSRPRTPLAIELSGTYWHFVTLIWAVLFVILYLV